jgi:lysylphosphatidylglycerol synthetase-like protein (DUF2156 family)
MIRSAVQALMSGRWPRSVSLAARPGPVAHRAEHQTLRLGEAAFESCPAHAGSGRLARRWRTAAGWLIAVAAVASAASAWLDRPLARQLGGLPASRGINAVLSVAVGAGLLALARGLSRGHRRAARAAAVLLAGSAAARLAAGGALEPAAAELVLAVAILATQAVFPYPGTPRAGRALGALVALAAGSAYAVAVAAVLAADQVKGLSAALEPAAGWLLAGGWWLRSGRPEALALDALLIMVLVATGLLVRELLRPIPAYDGHTPAEHARAAAIVAEHRVDSLDAFALREDKSFHFGAGGVLAYRVVHGTAIVAGDPIGPAGSAPAILVARVYVGRHDWRLWREKTPLMLRYAAARIAAP